MAAVTVPNCRNMSQKAAELIALCFNPACSNPDNSFGEQTCSGCGADLQLQGRYIAVQLMGQGGFGRTFLAIDRLQTPMVPCVVKQCWQDRDPAAQVKGSRSWSQLGIQQLTQLGTHSQLPTILDSFEQGGLFYWVEEYIVGNSLAVELIERGPFSPAEIWTILSGLLPILQYIHAHGVIHRDINPETVILRGHQITEHDLFLVDFGAAQLVTPTSLILPEKVVGSPEYAAPEQLAGKAVFASDLYSLGVTCLHLLTGMRPLNLFDFTNNQWIWRDCLPNQSHEHDDLGKILDRLIAPALSKRLASADAAIAAMPQTKRQNHTTLPPKPPATGQCQTTLKGHGGLFASINGVAFSPDGFTLASASDDRTVRIWQVQTATEIAVLGGQDKPVRAVAFPPHSNTRLVSGGGDGTIRIWDLVERRSVRRLIGHQGRVNALAFSPDGYRLASSSADKTITLWDFATGESLTTLTGHRLTVNAVTFSPTHPLLVSASADSTVAVWDLTRLKLVDTLTQHTASVRAIAFSPNGEILATGGEDRTIHLWDTASWQLIRTLSGHPWSVSALIFS
ncbi:MAG: protein kinase domain-containing protein, partial [Microcoleaceae cyanobacterium]